jgi:hypothetical protein
VSLDPQPSYLRLVADRMRALPRIENIKSSLPWEPSPIAFREEATKVQRMTPKRRGVDERSVRATCLIGPI